MKTHGSAGRRRKRKGQQPGCLLISRAVGTRLNPTHRCRVSPFFLTRGPEAALPLQLHLDEPRLDRTPRL